MNDIPHPAPALANAPAAAAASFSMVESASGLSGAASPRKEKKFELDTPDIVAIGVLCLALAAAVTSVIVALGFVFGKASGSDSLKIISTCVGGSTVSGVVAALIGNKKSR